MRGITAMILGFVFSLLFVKAAWSANYSWTENFSDSSNYTFNGADVVVSDSHVQLHSMRTGLIGWWSLNEGSGNTAHDSALTPYNGALTDPVWVTGKLGQAVSFDGDSTLMTTGTPKPASLPVTIAFWVKPNPTNTQNHIFDTGYGQAGCLRMSSPAAGVTYVDWHGESSYTVSPALPTGTWSHIAIVYKDAGTEHPRRADYYENGVLKGNIIGQFQHDANFTWTPPIYFGSIYSSEYMHNGVLDEPAIWNRELTQAEISGLYNNGNGWALPATAYPTNSPSIQPLIPIGAAWDTLQNWTSLSESATKPAGTEIKYQFSFDNGATWNWYTGSVWASTTLGASQANTAGQLTTSVMQAIYPECTTSRIILWRAFLISNGTNTPTLNSVTIGYSQSADTYKSLGAGEYDMVSPWPPEQWDLTTLDCGRWDWIWLSWTNSALGDEATWDGINAQLAMNPNQKYVVDLTIDLGQGMGNPNYAEGIITLFEYCYSETVNTEVQRRVRDEVDFVFAHCLMPQNIVGFCLQEELPNAFGAGSQIWDTTTYPENGTLPPVIQVWKTYMENNDPNLPAGCKVSGVLQWNTATKTYVGQLYRDSARELHTILKEKLAEHSSSAKIYVDWPAGFLDEPAWMHAGVTPTVWSQWIYPITWTEALFSATGTRLVDGIVTACLAPDITRAALWIANTYNTVFCPCLKHISEQRLDPWPDTMESFHNMTHPLYVGYFFFCPGNCNSEQYSWKNDPSFSSDPALNVMFASEVDHYRRFCAQEDIGMVFVDTALAPIPTADIALSGAAPGTTVPLTVLLYNPATSDFFAGSTQEETAYDVSLELILPPGCSSGQSLTWNVGDMPPQSCQKHVWTVQIDQAVIFETTIMQITASNRTPPVWKFAGDSVISSFQEYNIRRPSKHWIENTIGEASAVDAGVWFDALEPIDQPSLTIGADTVEYDAILQPGQKLLYLPWNSAPDPKALMFNGTLFETEVSESFITGGWVNNPCKGIAVWPYRNVAGLTQLRVTADGKVEGGAGSGVMLQYHCPTRPPGQQSHAEYCLYNSPNAFTGDWSAKSETVPVPADATLLTAVYLYRVNETGTVWYGAVTVDNETYSAGGDPVNDNLIVGSLPSPDLAADDFSEVTYSDASLISQFPKVKVRLARRMSVNITSPAGGTGYTAPATVNITAEASSLNGSVTSVSFYYNGANLIGTDNDGSNGWSATWNNAPAGFYTLTAVANDGTGTTTSSGVHIRVNGPPTVSITSPTQNQSFSVTPGSGATINITADASDADGAISKVEFYNNGIKIGEDTSSSGGWTYSWTYVAASGAGGIKLTAKAYDDLNVVTTSAVVSCTVTDTALKCYWKDDETGGSTAYDTSGNNNNGTLYNSPTRLIGERIINSLSFNGTNQYVQKASASGLPNVDATQTECFWFYVSSNPTATKTALAVTYGTASTGKGTGVGFINSGGMKFGVWRNSNKALIVSTSTLPSSGAWHHIAYVKSGSAKYLYIDGSSVSSANATDTSSTATYVTKARTNYSSGANFWPGKLDEVRIYNRALSGNEISALAQGKQ